MSSASVDNKKMKLKQKNRFFINSTRLDPYQFLFARLVKFFAIFFVLGFLFFGSVNVALAADVSIDTTTIQNARAIHSLVWTSATTGYVFYIDSDDDFFYKKTTDSGATWVGQTEIDTDSTIIGQAYDVWYDKWTPGDTGNLIHLWWLTSDDGDVNYVTVDTGNSDALGTQRLVFD